jgi:hypothetical protein
MKQLFFRNFSLIMAVLLISIIYDKSLFAASLSKQKNLHSAQENSSSSRKSLPDLVT